MQNRVERRLLPSVDILQGLEIQDECGAVELLALTSVVLLARILAMISHSKKRCSTRRWALLRRRVQWR